jgi:cytidylate kinase
MMKKLSIAIDGPAAAGKSTIAKAIAKEYHYVYIDTGAMYRSVAYYTKKNQICWEDEQSVVASLNKLELSLNSDGKVYLNDEDVTGAIRQNDISLGASVVSKYPKVREYLVSLQQEMAQVGGVVLDGRDIGTVVLPNADLKIYQIASVEARATRRHLENLEKGIASDLEKIKAEIEKRDYEDMHREASPLRKADDAKELDTSHLSIDEVLTVVRKWVDQKLSEVEGC